MELGGEKREMEGKGGIYNDDSGRAGSWLVRHLAVPRLAGCACHSAPIFFPYFPVSTRPRPHPRRGISWIVISPPHAQPLSFLFSLSRVTSSPCHLIFFTSSPISRLTRDGQTSPITSSNPISDLQIPASISNSRISPRPFPLTPLNSPHLTLSLCVAPLYSLRPVNAPQSDVFKPGRTI